jgi:hypothetical protein
MSHWNNSPHVNMSLSSDSYTCTSWFQINQSLLLQEFYSIPDIWETRTSYHTWDLRDKYFISYLIFERQVLHIIPEISETRTSYHTSDLRQELHIIPEIWETRISYHTWDFRDMDFISYLRFERQELHIIPEISETRTPFHTWDFRDKTFMSSSLSEVPLIEVHTRLYFCDSPSSSFVWLPTTKIHLLNLTYNNSRDESVHWWKKWNSFIKHLPIWTNMDIFHFQICC